MRLPTDQWVITHDAANHIARGMGPAVDTKDSYDNLYAPVSGIQRRKGNATTSEGGRWLILDGDDGYQYRFAHLHSYWVPNNTRVREGQHIAQTGNSGRPRDGRRSYPPHLHTEIWYNGHRIDPETFFKQKGTNVAKATNVAWEEEMKPNQFADLNILAAIALWERHHPGQEVNTQSIWNDLENSQVPGNRTIIELTDAWKKGL